MRFEKAKGAPIRTEDAPFLGQELLRIARAHQISNLRALSKEIVLEEVLADEDHPLRRFYNWDVASAAHSHWLERTQKLINSVRIIEADVRPRKPRKMFVAINDVRDTDEDGQTQTHTGMRVIAPDAAQHDAIFIQYLDSTIKRIEQALCSSEEWLERGTAPERYVQLLEELRISFDTFTEE